MASKTDREISPSFYSEVVMIIDLDPRKHGIDASQLAIRPEEVTEFNRFLAGLFDDMRPSGELQRILFGQILHACWNMRIGRRSESELLLEFGPSSSSLKTVSQFYARNERSFHKTIAELRNLQTELAYRVTLASNQAVDVSHVPPLVRTARVHKEVRSTTGNRGPAAPRLPEQSRDRKTEPTVAQRTSAAA